MKQSTINQRRVMELSPTLPDIREKDIEWIDKDFRRVYKNKGLSYYLIMERCKEFQVIRYYYKTRRRLFEFMQIWFNEQANVVLAKNRVMGVDKWIEKSEMRPKQWFRKYIEYSYLGGVSRIPWSGCKIRSLLPSLKKRGLKTSPHNIHPYYLSRALLDSNRVETLFKLRQYLLVSIFAWGDRKLTDELWQCIRVALRHGYHWDSRGEFMDWCDMLNDLTYMGLDTHSPHYICPANLNEAHQHWLKKANILREIKRQEEERKHVAEYEPIFKANREQFFGMVFTDKEISIQIIPTAADIKEEGLKMHHCVGGYYNKPYSLILSAKIDGQRVETIEVSLESYELVQSRGLQNKSTKYHKRIVKLIESNMKEIRKRNKGHKMITDNKLRKAV